MSQQTQNKIFDAYVSRLLTRSQYQQLYGQLAVLKDVAKLLTSRIAVTRDITRKKNLEDQLLSVLASEKSVRQQIEQAAFDALQFNVDKAGLTKNLTDDLAALRRYEAVVEERIKVAGDTLAREQTLLGIQQQIQQVLAQQAQNRADAAQKARDRIAARQFRALGFGPTGEDLVPGVKALQKAAEKIRDQIAGTFLDTRKTRSMLAHITQVLSGGLGKVGRDVRAKVKEILDGIENDLKNRQGFATRFSPASPEAITAAAGLNLNATQRRRLGYVLAGVSGGRVPVVSSPAFAGAGGVTINGDVNVHGVQNPRQFEEQMTKRHNSRPKVRRGAR